MSNLELLEKASSFISLKDLYNLYIKDDSLANVYGDYNTFANDSFVEGLKKTVYDIREEKDKENFYWIIICKKKLIPYIKDLIEYFIEYYKERKDLSFWLRLRMSYVKTIRWVRRINFVIDIFDYSHFPESYNRKIKKLFDDNKTNNVYIYKLNKDSFFKYQFAMKYKR